MDVLWDRFGVAHVYGKRTADLFYGFGWAQAHSHGEILARLYAEGRGTAAEYYGESELANDRWMAINDVPARSESWLAAQNVAFRTNLEAFAAGITAYATAHPDAFSVEARRVFPVTAVDVIAYAQRLFQFTYAAPASIVNRLPPDAPDATDARAATPLSDVSQADGENDAVTEAAGSNGWAIAPSRTATGRAMLLMNPHLPWARGWATYYEVQLKGAGIELYGATQIGLPVLRFVFSDTLGFTHTVNSPNAVTFYRLAPEDGGYRYDGKVVPFQSRTAILKVRQSDGTLASETLTVRSSVQGPIVGERGGAPIAMRVAGLDRPFALEQYWHMATARDFAGFQKALRAVQVPTFNVIYADRDGHIEYLYNGLVPRHSFGDLAYWMSTVPGDTSKTMWNDYLSYEELPKIIDPPGGTVQNSNDPPWDAAWPTVLDGAPYHRSIPGARVDLRMERGIRMLSQTQRISFEDLIADKWSTHSELADRILPDLLDAVERFGDESAKQAAAVLARWDRSTDADSRGALLFLKWSDATGGLNGYAARGFATPFDLREPLTTPAGLADPEGAVRALEAAAREMLVTYGALDTRWGDVMRLRIDGLDLPGRGGPGRLGIFDVIDYGPVEGGTRAANFGGSYEAIVSFEHPVRAKVLLTYGASSQAGSPHANDQLRLLSRTILRDAWRTRAEVEANLESQDRF